MLKHVLSTLSAFRNAAPSSVRFLCFDLPFFCLPRVHRSEKRLRSFVIHTHLHRIFYPLQFTKILYTLVVTDERFSLVAIYPGFSYNTNSLATAVARLSPPSFNGNENGSIRQVGAIKMSGRMLRNCIARCPVSCTIP